MYLFIEISDFYPPGPGPARAALPRVQPARRRRALPLRHHAGRRALRGLLRARAQPRARRPAEGDARRRPRLVLKAFGWTLIARQPNLTKTPIITKINSPMVV